MATPNALFAILNVSDPEALKERLSRIESWTALELQVGEWLLVAPGSVTTKEISEQLGVLGEGAKGTALIVRVDTYFGRNYPTVWEWISAKRGADLGVAASAQ